MLYLILKPITEGPDRREQYYSWERLALVNYRLGKNFFKVFLLTVECFIIPKFTCGSKNQCQWKDMDIFACLPRNSHISLLSGKSPATFSCNPRTCLILLRCVFLNSLGSLFRKTNPWVCHFQSVSNMVAFPQIHFLTLWDAWRMYWKQLELK